jgi:hypothetical protein
MVMNWQKIAALLHGQNLPDKGQVVMNFYAYIMDSWKEALHKQVSHSVLRRLKTLCRCFCLYYILFYISGSSPYTLLGVQGMSGRAMKNN